MKSAHIVQVDGLRLRVSIEGRGRPLLLLNGIGCAVELMTPLRANLPGIESIAVDMPGTGESQTPPWPRRFRGLAHLLDRLLGVLGYHEVDVFGISWGGGMAQEFAHRHPERVKKLVLAATATGWTIIPGEARALWVLATPRRYYSHEYFESIAPILYGGAVRDNPHLLRDQGHLSFIRPPSMKGYLFQLLAGAGWTSLPWLHRLRMPTLVMCADDDPIIRLFNARVMAWRLPHATLDVIPRGGHLFALTHAAIVGPRIARFLLDG